MEGERTFLSPVLRPVERAIYRVCGVDETAEQGWKGYTVSRPRRWRSSPSSPATSMLRLQDVLPLNPGGDRRHDAGARVQHVGQLRDQHQLAELLRRDRRDLPDPGRRSRSATSPRPRPGLAVAIALVRGLTRRSSTTIGNYWVDLTRGVLYILLPIAIVGALVLVWQGVPQTWNAPADVTTLEGAQQTIASGRSPPRSSIKELGNNGGGFLNANSAHPFENPTPLTNWLEMFAILIIPFALTYTFGRYAGDQRQGWTIFAAMAAVLVVGAVVAMHAEYVGNPLFPAGVDQAASATWRARRSASAPALGGLFVAVTTGTSTGAINAWHDSFQPIAGLVPLFNMELGEITPGRHRRRHVRHARHRRHPGGVHRRPDGRPDARVPGQEGRGLRDEDGDARRPRPGRQHPRLHGARVSVLPEGTGRVRSTRAPTASARSCTPSRARPATTARRSPA